MSVALFYLLITSVEILSVIVSGQYNLPQRGECGTINENYYYNHKRISELGEFPWMGEVVYKNKIDNTLWYQCYSVLINKWFVLMTARCFQFEEEAVQVLLGDWNEGNDDHKSDCDDRGRCAPVPKLYKIEEIIIHPNYTYESKKNDIALVRLSEPVTYSDFIRPICLPSKDKVEMDFDNQLLEETGWLYNKSTILAKSFARVVKPSTCDLSLKNLFKVDVEQNICALNCWGDNVYASGSALMDTTVVDEEPVNYYLIGLKLYGLSKCNLGKPYIYIRVDRYLDWIYEITNKESLMVTPRK